MSDAQPGWPPLVEMATGYFRSRALAAAARLGIADALADGERTVEQLASACQADPFALSRLLRALASVGIVSEFELCRIIPVPGDSASIIEAAPVEA